MSRHTISVGPGPRDCLQRLCNVLSMLFNIGKHKSEHFLRGCKMRLCWSLVIDSDSCVSFVVIGFLKTSVLFRTFVQHMMTSGGDRAKTGGTMITHKEFRKEIAATWSFVADLHISCKCLMRQIKTNALARCNTFIPSNTALFSVCRSHVGVSCILYSKLLSEAVNDVFTKWSCIPSGEGASIHCSPLSRCILVLRSLFNGLMLM